MILLAFVTLVVASNHKLRKQKGENIKQRENERQTQKDILAQISKSKIRQDEPYEDGEEVLTYKDKLEDSIPRFIDNIQFLGQGYNIYFGNPKCTKGLDPGFTNFGVSSFDYTSNPYYSLSRDYSMYVPKGYIATNQQSCTISFSSKAISSTKDYISNLQASASVNVKLAGSFSASSDYKQTQSGLQSNESLYIESSARCTAYEIVMTQDPLNSPNVTPEFAEVLRDLESKGDNANAYYDFFDEVGTHVTDEMELGSLFGYRFEMSTKETQKLVKQNVNVAAAASYMATRARAKTSYEQEQENQMKTAVSSWTSFSIGAAPDENNDALQWAARTISNPMPVYINLVTMTQYLRIYGSPSKIGVSNLQYSNLINRFDNYLSSYCKDRLLVRGDLGSCEEVNIQAPVDIEPSKSNNFVEQLCTNNSILNFINKKSGRFLGCDNNDKNLNVQIENYVDNPQQKWTLQRLGTTDSIYLIKHRQTNMCLSLRNCNNDYQVPTVKKCNPSDVCQQFRIQIFNAANQEIIIQSMKSGKILKTDDNNEGNNTNSEFNDSSDTTARIWRIQKSLTRFVV